MIIYIVISNNIILGAFKDKQKAIDHAIATHGGDLPTEMKMSPGSCYPRYWHDPDGETLAVLRATLE